MTVSPCKGCETRELGCHSRCEGYKNFRERLDAANAAEKEARKTADYWWDFGTKLERRYRKSYNRNRR